MFTILACYYASTLHKHLWDENFVFITFVYALGNLGFLFGTVAWALQLTLYKTQEESVEYRDSVIFDVQGLLMGIAHLCLATVLTVFIIRFVMVKRQKLQSPLPLSMYTLLIVLTSYVAFAVFVRSVFDFFAMASSSVRERFDFYGEQKHDVNLWLFLLLLFWEVVPILAVMGFFARLRTAGRADVSVMFTERFSHPLRTAVQRIEMPFPHMDLPRFFAAGSDLSCAGSMEAQKNLFNDPHRYDSDNDLEYEDDTSAMYPLLPKTPQATIL
eukprot:Rmarinus@m.8395